MQQNAFYFSHKNTYNIRIIAYDISLSPKTPTLQFSKCFSVGPMLKVISAPCVAYCFIFSVHFNGHEYVRKWLKLKLVEVKSFQLFSLGMHRSTFFQLRYLEFADINIKTIPELFFS